MQNRLWAMARPASGVKGNAGQETVVCHFSDQLYRWVSLYVLRCLFSGCGSWLPDEHRHGPEAAKMLATGFVAFVLPFASRWLIEKIAVLKVILWNLIKS